MLAYAPWFHRCGPSGSTAVLTVVLTWPLAANLTIMDAGRLRVLRLGDRLGGPRAQDRPGEPPPRRTSSTRSATRWGWTSRSWARRSSSCPSPPSPTTRCCSSNVARLLTFVVLRAHRLLAGAGAGRGRGTALLAGAAFAFSPIRTDQIAHLSTLGTQWLPLVVLFAVRFARTGAWRDALLSALFFVLGLPRLRLPRRDRAGRAAPRVPGPALGTVAALARGLRSRPRSPASPSCRST